MNDRTEVLKKLLSEAEEALVEAEQARQEATLREEAFRAEVEGLRIALSAHHPKPQATTLFQRAKEAATNGVIIAAEVAVARDEWRAMPRTDAIERVYAEVKKPLHRKELVTQLQMRGRTDSLIDVSAALAYLKRVNRAESLGQGRWLVRVSPNGSAPTDQGGDA